MRALLLLLLCGTAHADDAFAIGSLPSYTLLGGVTSGGTAYGNAGAYVGGELSIARLRDASFVGVYADGYYAWGIDAPYVTAGVELGHKFFGVDGGVALRWAAERDTGVTGRITVGIGVVGVYARYAHFFDAMRDDNVVQLGLVLKLPLWTSGGMQ